MDDAALLKGKGERRWVRWALCGVFAVAILAIGLWVGVAKFGWFDGSIGIAKASTEREVTRMMSRNLTEQLINDAITYKNAHEDDRGAALVVVKDTASRRQEYAEVLMKEDPDEFLRIAIGKSIRESLLDGIDGVEEEITVEGTIEILCILGGDEEEHDHEAEGNYHKVGYHVYKLVIDEDKYYEIYTADENLLEDLNPKDRVRATGYELGGKFVPDILSDSANFEVIDASLEQVDTEVRNRKVAVVMLSNTPTPRAGMATAAMYLTIMDSLKSYFEEVSFGQMTISGKENPNDAADIKGYYTLLETISNCDYSADRWEAKARAAATAGGFSATGYDHVMYMMPNINSTLSNGCFINGFAYYNNAVSVFNSYKMLRYTDDPDRFFAPSILESLGIIMPNGVLGIIDTLAHELGHNFGFGHAKSLDCFNAAKTEWVSVSNNCSDPHEYGDRFDTMGSGENYPSHFSAYFKHMGGWIPAERVTRVTTNGTYDVYPLEVTGTGPQLIHVPVTQGSTTFNYYLDFKTPRGFNLYPATMGVFVRSATTNARNGTTLYNMDTSPCNANPSYVPGTFQSCFTVSGTWRVSLQAGKWYTDSIRGVSFRLVSRSDEKAVVEVRFTSSPPPAPTCTRRAPTITVTPMVSTIGLGESVVYAATVRNNDSVECTVADFAVAVSRNTTGPILPSPATATLTSIAPGMEKSRNFTVRAPANTTSSLTAYQLTFTASNDASGSDVKVADFNVINSSIGPTPTITITSTPNVADGGTIDPALNTRYLIKAEHPNGISKIEIRINGKLVAACNDPKGSTCDVWIKGSNTAVGMHTLKADAVSKNSINGTASITFKR